MKVFVIGSGGREHTLVWKLKQSNKVSKIYAAPGNAGISKLAECINIKVDDIRSLVAYAKQEAIDITIVGPELPLVLGIVDAFEAEGLKIFGPNKEASQFEGSKDYTKSFLMRHHIPTAKYKSFTSPDKAKEVLASFGYPVVIKADGLAAGKGVIIAEDEAVAVAAIDDMMTSKVFGDAGSLVVLEEFLKGIEASILCFVDGKTIVPMQPAQDYKKIFDGDEGLNTGGMGTYSPSQIIDDALMARIQEEILNPFITGIQKDGITFKGILFVGIMIDGDKIDVLEYNVRLGDPETEVTLPRMKTDLVTVIEAILEERLEEVKLEWVDQHAVCVVMASGGYPEAYEKGYPITGLDAVSDGVVFHCGTRKDGDEIVTNGGRVLGVMAMGDDLETARAKAYENVKAIQFEKAFYRNDIAKKITR
jgi:phosphoribosylamine--glycine ligase